MPTDHTPIVIKISAKVGEYRAISPRGEGINPGTIKLSSLLDPHSDNYGKQCINQRAFGFLVWIDHKKSNPYQNQRDPCRNSEYGLSSTTQEVFKVMHVLRIPP